MKQLMLRLWRYGALGIDSQENEQDIDTFSTITVGRVFFFCALLVLSWLPMLLGRGAITQVAGLYWLGATPQPYFQPNHAGLLYIVTPVVVVSSFIFFLSPGVLWVLAFGQSRRCVELVPFAFGTSLVLFAGLTTIAKLALGAPLSATMLVALWLVNAGVPLVILFVRISQRAALPWPFAQTTDRRRLLWMLLIPIFVVVLLLPKLFWENFNEDGIEAFEFGRSLKTHLLPHWEITAGAFGFYQNYVLFAYPNYWFTTLFGRVEVAARLPFALYLTVIFAALVLLIEWPFLGRKLNSGLCLRWREEGVLLLGLAVFTVVVCYNGTYDPYCADIAEPAAPDTLIVACMVMTTYLFWSGRVRWFWLFAMMTYMAGPNGLLFLGLLGLATVVWWSEPRHKLILIGKVVLVCCLAGLLYEFVYNPWVLGEFESQYSSKNLLRRLLPPSLGHLARLNLLIFPSGILPAFVLCFAFWQKSTVCKALSTVILGYFSLVYSQSWVSLHQFTPILVLPLVVFWQCYLDRGDLFRRVSLPILTISTLLALGLSLPRHFQINQAYREFGHASLYRIGDYEDNYPLALRHAKILYEFLPNSGKLDYPNQKWSIDHRTWIYYAMCSKPSSTSINYVVQPETDSPPPGFTRQVTREGLAVYIRDADEWRRHRSLQLPHTLLSPLYEPVFRETYEFFQNYMKLDRQR